MKKFKAWFFALWILIVLVAYLILLPPINVTSVGFWSFFLPAVFLPLFIITQGASLKTGLKKGKALWPVYLVILCVIVYFIGSILLSPVFNSKNYTTRITITTSSFEQDIKEVDFNNLPLLDKNSSQKVGDRVVGQVSDLVSQFSVSDEYSLINYQGSIVRVTPLEHNGFFKYLSNLNGTAGYVIVDTTSGEAQIVRTSEGLKYLPSAYGIHDLLRHVRLGFPFDNFGETSFEIDELGNPYWVIQTINYTWVGLKPQVNGVIVCNAINGKMEKYSVNEVPSWIDNVYDANLVINEIDSWGLYQGGFLNSLFAQKNVVQTTDGYTYITKDDDVYMYTGITSISSDESNIGFVMVNLRTHQANYYEVPGAEEYSAMDSAIGAVQEKNYTSTFPLLINLAGNPTYLLSLKDSAGLVKMYAFVDVTNYQKVSVTDASLGIENAAKEYLKLFNKTNVEEQEQFEAILLPETIKEVVIDGNTTFIIKDKSGSVYKLSVSINPQVSAFLEEEGTYHVIYVEEEGMRVIQDISLIVVEDSIAEQ